MTSCSSAKRSRSCREKTSLSLSFFLPGMGYFLCQCQSGVPGLMKNGTTFASSVSQFGQMYLPF